MGSVSVCCVLGLKDCPKHQDCSICVKDGLKKGRVEGAIAERKRLSKLFYKGYNNKLNFKQLEKELAKVGEQK